MDPDGKRVVIALSGGVDSSVAAALLVEQGYDVVGMMLRLWSAPGNEAANRCCAPDAVDMARRIAYRLGIPFYVIDARQPFYDTVVAPSLLALAQGLTPNPCVFCNRHIRWRVLLDQALAIDAAFLATGHYARIRATPTGLELLKGIDPLKDQSYVLHMLSQEQLRHALFPIGHLTKPQVRDLARKFNLPVADRPESQDLCFLGDQPLRDFIVEFLPEARRPGPIFDSHGKLLGQHQGLAFYTIGQRKGLGIPSLIPLYVLEKQPQENAIIVGPEHELGKTTLRASDVSWISGTPPPLQTPIEVRIRYKAKDAPARLIQLTPGGVMIEFDAPARDITPGQAVVFYSADICLGGGTISA